MNVTPLAPGPVPTAPPGTENAAAPGDFLAALAAALGTEQAPADAGTSGGTVPTIPADPCPQAGTDETAATTDLPSPETTPEVAPDLAADLAPDLAADLVATGAVPVPTAAPVTPAVPGAAHRSANGAEHQRADDAPGRLHAAERPSLTRGTEPTTPTGTTTTGTTTTGTTTTGITPDSVPVGEQAATPATQPATQQATPAPTATGPAPIGVPLTAAPVTAGATTPTAAPSAQLDQVTAQVFPEITGLVSRGSGTHRITLTLQPEQLGEVRVVMTLRQGAVHVRLAAGHDAQISLAAGTAELTRLLEQAGVTDARIVVRDLPAAATQNSPTLPTTANPDAQLGAGGQRNPDQDARTRADQTATDGAAHPRNHRSPVAAEVRPIQPVTGSRTAGVDLTM